MHLLMTGRKLSQNKLFCVSLRKEICHIMCNVKVTWKFDTFGNLNMIVLCRNYNIHFDEYLNKQKSLHVGFIVQNYIYKSDSREKDKQYIKDENDLQVSKIKIHIYNFTFSISQTHETERNITGYQIQNSDFSNKNQKSLPQY